MASLTVGITAYNESLQEVMKTIESVKNITGIDIIISVDDNYSLFKQIKNLYPENKVVFSKTNIGLGRSRNKIIKICETNWLTFLDSGDSLNKDVLKKFLKTQKKNVDVYFYQTEINFRAQTIVNKQIIQSKYRLLYENCYMNFSNAITSKILNLSFLKQNNLYFEDKNLYHEDLLFTPHLYCKMKKYRTSLETLYNWNREEKSLSTSISLKKFSDLAYIFHKRRIFYKDIYEIIDFKTIKKRERRFVLNIIKSSKKYQYLLFYFKFIIWDHE